MSNEPASRVRFSPGWFPVVLVVAVALTIVFWLPLYQGAGFVGGDVYSYYLPQKDVFKEAVTNGELPLWNNRTGWGYPLVAESQTGVFYPFTWLFYVPLDLNTAYNANHLTHYVLAFIFTCLYARRLGLRTAPALLAGVIYVYGWFPPRCSLEWAIIGGTWLPAALWTAEAFLQTNRTRWATALSVVLCLQLLAGHFSIAFITLLTLAAYIPLRLWFVRARVEPQRVQPKTRMAVVSFAAIGFAFLLAAVQLLPTWELKANSQRADVTEEHNPEYGHLPPGYMTQLAASWWWHHSPEITTDQDVQNMDFLASDARTNKVEAHLYFGLIPLLLLVVMLFRGRLFARNMAAAWGVIGLLFLVYTPGWLCPFTQNLPGFSFFEGPARYGVTATLAAAMVAAIAMNQFTKSGAAGNVACLVVAALTAAEFYVVADQVAVARMVPEPPITFRDTSPVRKVLSERKQESRLFALGANTPNLFEVSAMPVYLGLSPSEYFTPELMPPVSKTFASRERIGWMQRAGITHVMTSQATADPRVREIYLGPDPLLNRAWGDNRDVHVYELIEARSRAFSLSGDVQITEIAANKVVLEANLDAPGQVVLTDLMFPGWEVEVDPPAASTGTATRSNPTKVEDVFRTVNAPAGKSRITWRYRPAGFRNGLIVSAAGWLLLVGLVIFGSKQRRTK